MEWGEGEKNERWDEGDGEESKGGTRNEIMEMGGDAMAWLKPHLVRLDSTGELRSQENVILTGWVTHIHQDTTIGIRSIN